MDNYLFLLQNHFKKINYPQDKQASHSKMAPSLYVASIKENDCLVHPYLRWTFQNILSEEFENKITSGILYRSTFQTRRHF